MMISDKEWEALVRQQSHRMRWAPLLFGLVIAAGLWAAIFWIMGIRSWL